MKSILALSLLAETSASWVDRADYSFVDFVRDFEMEYKLGSEEWSKRETLFINTELSRVHSFNKQGRAWTEDTYSSSFLFILNV